MQRSWLSRYRGDVIITIYFRPFWSCRGSGRLSPFPPFYNIRGKKPASSSDISETIAKHWVISCGKALSLDSGGPSARIAIEFRAQAKERTAKSLLSLGCDFSLLVIPCSGHLMPWVGSWWCVWNNNHSLRNHVLVHVFDKAHKREFFFIFGDFNDCRQQLD